MAAPTQSWHVIGSEEEAVLTQPHREILPYEDGRELKHVSAVAVGQYAKAVPGEPPEAVVGEIVATGLMVGLAVGFVVGFDVGLDVGIAVGLTIGFDVGLAKGLAVG